MAVNIIKKLSQGDIFLFQAPFSPKNEGPNPDKTRFPFRHSVL